MSWENLAPGRDMAPSVITLGNFDGVHLGHRLVLERLIALAGQRGLIPVAITFEPHPRHVFRPDDPCSRLGSPAEKARWLAEFPVKIITLRFDSALAATPAETFIKDFLLGHLLGKAFLLGHDHRFGAGARGDAAMLRSLGGPGVEVEETAPLHHQGELVSSSGIRRHLEAGHLEIANSLLGRQFSYTGRIVAGAGRAKTLDMPTANIDPGCPEKVRVASGVYFGEAAWEDQRHLALANIGFAPTFAEGKHKLEVHIPGFSGDLYGKDLTFSLMQFCREERRFSTPEALKTQIQADLVRFNAFVAAQKGN